MPARPCVVRRMLRLQTQTRWGCLRLRSALPTEADSRRHKTTTDLSGRSCMFPDCNRYHSYSGRWGYDRNSQWPNRRMWRTPRSGRGRGGWASNSRRGHSPRRCGSCFESRRSSASRPSPTTDMRTAHCQYSPHRRDTRHKSTPCCMRRGRLCSDHSCRWCNHCPGGRGIVGSCRSQIPTCRGLVPGDRTSWSGGGWSVHPSHSCCRGWGHYRPWCSHRFLHPFHLQKASHRRFLWYRHRTSRHPKRACPGAWKSTPRSGG
jgi:hypothetical protein